LGKYWIDADALIQAKNGLYSFSIAMKFWAFLERQAKAGTVCSSIEIYKEVLKFGDATDDLAKWVKQRRNSGLFCVPDKEVQAAYRQVADYVVTRYEKRMPKVTEFLKGGDGWIIAHAMCDKGTVVSHENRLDSQALTPKIPNVCRNFGVGCIVLPEMLERLKFKF
jgi:hypothetical protein